MNMRPKVRLFIEGEISVGQAIRLDPQKSHYLISVMRMDTGAEIEIFNGESDAWAAEIVDAHRKHTVVAPNRVTASFQPLSDIWLLFAPIKKARTDFIVEKATELGVSRIVPVFTEFTNSERLRPDRLRAHAIEAAEQCGGTAVPDLEEPVKLASLLSSWPEDRHLFFCDEASAGNILEPLAQGPAAILIGPEGGFSPTERETLRELPFVDIMELGPRILRADTATVAAITRWMVETGRWSR